MFEKSKKISKSENAITLISLVITIVLLVILAGIVINATIGSNGIINMVKQKQKEYKKSEYFEEINIEILEENMERNVNSKEEAFIVSLRDRLRKKTEEPLVVTDSKYPGKDWVETITIYNSDNSVNISNPSSATFLILETTDGYELYIDVNNVTNIATIRENSFNEISKRQIHTITYNANSGTGTTEGTTVRDGFKIILPENGFSKAEFEFVGWTLDSANSGIVYSAGSSSATITEDTTFYAKWSRNVVTIQYDANGGSGSMETTPVTINQSTELRTNTFIPPTGYEFEKWTTNSDGTGTSYTNSITITDNTHDTIKIYAKWRPKVIAITLDEQSGSGGTTTIYEKYNTGYYTDLSCTIQMTTSTNGITVPTRTGYAFRGYYTETDGEGTQYINENGVLTENANTTNFTTVGTLYAKWITNYSIEYILNRRFNFRTKNII